MTPIDSSGTSIADTSARTVLWEQCDDDLKKRIDNLRTHYEQLFGTENTAPFIATISPGRAEILGNHTDYNEGFTLSANIQQNLLLLGKPRKDTIVRVVSLNTDGNIVEFSTDSVETLLTQKSALHTQDDWTNYVKGVLWAFKEKELPVIGFDAIIESTIPSGAGVSSSSAIELATAYFISASTKQAISPEEVVPLCKHAENEYVGAPTGYLDQATEALADSGLLYIDYRPSNEKPFTFEQVAADVKKMGYTFVIGYDPLSKHVIVDGKYGARRKVCFESHPILSRLLHKEIKALRDVSSTEFSSIKDAFLAEMGETAMNYVTHIIDDNERVLAGIVALKNNNAHEFGSIMTASGASSIYLYGLDEDAPELRFVYETVVQNLNEWGVAGIRNMGGGFTAATLALVKKEKLDNYKEALYTAYEHAYKRSYQFIDFVPTPAAGVIDLSILQ